MTNSESPEWGRGTFYSPEGIRLSLPIYPGDPIASVGEYLAHGLTASPAGMKEGDKTESIMGWARGEKSDDEPCVYLYHENPGMNHVFTTVWFEQFHTLPFAAEIASATLLLSRIDKDVAIKKGLINMFDGEVIMRPTGKLTKKIVNDAGQEVGGNPQFKYESWVGFTPTSGTDEGGDVSGVPATMSDASENKPIVHPAPPAGRPYDIQILRTGILAKAMNRAALDVKVSKSQLGGLTGAMNKMFIGIEDEIGMTKDDARHIVLNFFFSVATSALLSGGEAQALIEWVDSQLVEGEAGPRGGKVYAANPHSKVEAIRIVQFMLEQTA